ncbi:MAG: amino acid ABC transporter permease [Clostridia bacterium]|nr:amino acid ABC transporter permease [Clostridia bacterium]
MDTLNADNLKYLAIGAGLSLFIAVLALIFGTLLGVIGAMGKLSKKWLPRSIASVYVEIFRGTPMLLQIIFFFVALPLLVKSITGVRWTPPPLLIGVLALSINSGAYSTELIRSGIQGVDKGQTEAARSLGLSQWQTMRYVILPQAFKRIVPPMVSEFIILIKDSSLVSVIGVYELMKRSRAIGARIYDAVPPLLVAGAMYLTMTLIISRFAKKLEVRLNESD